MGIFTRRRKQSSMAGLLMLLAWMFPLEALAQATPSSDGLFTPAAGDKAMMIMSSLFGKLGVFGPSSSDAFSSVIQVFNGACLFIGGILVAYTILAGTLGTAHDGEMLGKKFSSVWLPIRTALGTSLVLPVLPGGYCALQGIVGWLIVQSIGMASSAWQTYLSAANLSSSVTMNIQSPDGKQFAYTTFQSLVCVEALKVANAAEGAEMLGGNLTNFGITKVAGLKDVNYYFGDMNETAGFKRDTCGSLSVTKFSVAGVTSTSSPINTLLGGPAALMEGAEALKRSAKINAEHVVQVEAMLKLMQVEAAELVKTKQPIDITKMEAGIALYETAIKATATREIASLAPFKGLTESAERDGFLLAGAYYMKLASLSDLVNRSMAATPVASGPSSTAVAGVYADEMKGYMEAIERTVAQTNRAVTFGLGDVGRGEEEDSSWWDKIKAKLDVEAHLKEVIRTHLNFAIQDKEHPLIALKRLGNTVLQMGSAIGVGLVSIIALANGPLTGVALAGQTLAQILVAPLMLAGVFLSYVVPNMPFFMWLGAIIGWVLLVIEAMIAAPLWAIMHLHPNGDDMAGKGGNGYTLVLSLLLRPILLVFGFIASLTVLQVFGQLYNMIFADVFLMNTSDDTSWFMLIITFLASGLIYAGGVWVIVKKSFGIMTDIPDNIINWIGSSSGQLGKHSNDVGGLSSGAYIATQQASQMSGTISNTGMKAASERAADKRSLTTADNKQALNLDNEMGYGTADAMNKLNNSENNEGLTSHQSIEKQGKLKQGLSMFGGRDSTSGLAFMAKFKQSVHDNPESTFNDHLRNAVQSGFNNSVGSSGLDLAYKAAYGGEADSLSPDADYLSDDFQRATKYLTSMGNRMESQGKTPDEITSAFSDISTKVNDAYRTSPDSVANGGKKEFKHFFSDEIKAFRG